MANIEDLYLPYPDFKLQEIIDPEQFDINNEYTVIKMNEVLEVVNQLINGVDGESGADLINLTPITGFVSNQLQTFLEEVVSILQSSDGSSRIGTPALEGLPGSTVAQQLVSIKAQLVGHLHDERYYTKQDTYARGEFDLLKFELATQSFVATANQTVFTLTNGTYTVGKNRMEVVVGGVEQTVGIGSAFAVSETSSTSVTLSEGVPTGTIVVLNYYAGEIPIQLGIGHNTTHEIGSYDEIDLTKLKNYNAVDVRLTKAQSVSDKTLRPITLDYDYEKSPSKSYPNFLTRLRTGDLTKMKVVFVGNSHSAGQGATDTGGEKVPQLAPPAGVTDGFHKRDNSSGVFVDKVARQMEKAYGLSITKRVVASNETTYYNLLTGTWSASTDIRMLDASGAPNIQTSSVIGNSIIKQLDPTVQQRCTTIHFARLPSGGKFDVLIKTNNTAGLSGLTRNDANVWKKPSEISGVVRSDGVTGVNMDAVDLYNATGDYAYSLGFTFPFFANWQIKFTVSASKNASSTGNLCVVGTTVLDHENFINAGRGNHTTLDYLGNTVTKGAGGGGDFDHTDHLAEVLAFNPSLIILEPMIINDWFHGEGLQDTTSCIQEMIQRIKKANCDVLVVTPAPVVTDLVVLDYNEHPNYISSPPLLNNLHGLGSYEKYIDAILKVAYWEQVPVINNYKYFLERFYKTDHQNWTIGSLAGRIHVNQHGHDIYYDGIIQNSGLFPKTINSL